jgi:hypothetical protein
MNLLTNNAEKVLEILAMYVAASGAYRLNFHLFRNLTFINS